MAITFANIAAEIGDDTAKWQRLWRSLIVSEAFALRMPITSIGGGDNTTASDGGSDIVVEGVPKGTHVLLPEGRSVWSVKSGKVGLKAGTLTGELSPKKHPDLVAQLRSGTHYGYCVCAPTTAKSQRRLHTAADKVAIALEIPRDRITLCFDDTLMTLLKRHPGVLNEFCPKLGRGLGRSLDQWRQISLPSFDTSVPFVAFPARESLLTEIKTHLTDGTGDAVLHIAGFSGVGKSRLVYEACRQSARQDVMYFANYTDAADFVRRVADEPSLQACIVIDECRTEEVSDAESKLGSFASRIRCVTIGPARLGDARRGVVRVIAPPDSEDAVLQVLQAANSGSSVSPAALKVIAEQSGRDFRYALLLLKAVSNDPTLLDDLGKMVAALNDPRIVLNRVITLFGKEIALADDFSMRYAWLTLGRDIGWRNKRQEELEYVAKRSHYGIGQMKDAVHAALTCGLGESPAHLFEAIPRGLANVIFEKDLWPRIEPEFEALFNEAPSDSLRQSIMQRAELCTDKVRLEVASRVDSAFRDRLGTATLNALVALGDARFARAWMEFSPTAALAWLRQVVDSATIEELRTFKGDRGLFLGSGQRRQILFGLEHLSCFGEHYEACEPILFRLAVAENEQITNSATGIWCERQRIILSNAQTPYEDRMTLLLQRFAQANEESFGLLLAGMLEAVKMPFSVGRPPSVIGGRLVPDEWRPNDGSDYELFVDTINRCIAAIKLWPNELQSRAADVFIDHLDDLYKQDTADEVETFLSAWIESPARQLRLLHAVEETISRLTRHQKQNEGQKLQQLIARLRGWATRLQPKRDLERVRAVVARPTWEFDRLDQEYSRDRWVGPYTEAAKLVLGRPAILVELQEWLQTAADDGPRALGEMLFKHARTAEVDVRLERWLRDALCISVTCGYLTAAHETDQKIPDWATSALDDLVETKPEYVARVTSFVDPTEAGFARIQRCLSITGVDPAKALDSLLGYRWQGVLTPERQAWAIGQLLPEAGQATPSMQAVAVHLLRLYLHLDGKASVPPPLRSFVRTLVTDPPDSLRDHDWRDLATKLAIDEPQPVIEAATELSIENIKEKWRFSKRAIETLIDLHGKYGSTVELGVLACFAKHPYWAGTHGEEWQRLFGLFDLAKVQQFAKTQPVNFSQRLGHVVPDPSVDKAGAAVVPPITEWYLRTYGHDEKCYRNFSVGRWNGKMRSGWAWQNQGSVDRLVEVYSKSSIPALRRWAKESADQQKIDAQRDRIEYEDENNRG